MRYMGYKRESGGNKEKHHGYEKKRKGLKRSTTAVEECWRCRKEVRLLEERQTGNTHT